MSVRNRLRSGAVTALLSLLAFAVTATAITVIRNSTSDAGAGSEAALAGGRFPGRGSGAIESLQTHLRRTPADWRAWAELGAGYVQNARITGDPTLYPKAESAFRRSLKLERKKNFEALAGLGALAAARHDFPASLRYAEQARAINPANANVWGVMGDALVELGRYEEANKAFQRMVDLRPGLPSYARVSYSWELRGETSKADEALRLALDGAGNASDAAFAEHQMGELWWNAGEIDRAEKHYARAAKQDPAFVAPLVGLARVAAARGKTAQAVEGYGRATDRSPLPEYVAELANLYAAEGDRQKFADQAGLLELQEKLLQENGVNTDVTLAVFKADHGIDLAGGLRAARAAWDRQPSIFAADALAWQLWANGKHEEALAMADKALTLGMRNALFHFHRGMIRLSLGMTDEARDDLSEAISINPHFSPLWAPRAALELKRLG